MDILTSTNNLNAELNLDKYIAATNRAQQAEEYQLGNCDRVLHLGYFFDGSGRNIEQDASDSRLSNIAKLYRAFPSPEQDTSNKKFLAHYFSGLGTTFNDNLADKLQAVMDSSNASLSDDIESLPSDILTDAGADLVKGKSWYEVLSDIKGNLISPKEWALLAAKSASKATGISGVEATPWLRDNPFISDMMVSGVDIRLATAKSKFIESIEKARKEGEIPLKLVSVSLFGFDLGGAIARKFLDEIINNICEKDDDDRLVYQGVFVDIPFMGLFDCSRHTAASSDDGLDFVVSLVPQISAVSTLMGEKSIGYSLAVPKRVKRTLHFIAAQERRLWRPVYRTGLKNDENHKEKLVPGCSEDVGGGLKADEQKPSAELSLCTLIEMYETAEKSGVPFPEFRKLDKIDTDIATYFIMKDSVKGNSKSLVKTRQSVKLWVEEYQKGIPENWVNIRTLNQHLDSYFIWLGEKYYEYKLELANVKSSEDSENRKIILSYPYDTQNQINKANIYSEKIAILKKQWGWLDDIWDKAVKLRNNFRNHPHEQRLQLQPQIWYPAFNRALWLCDCQSHAFQNLPMPSHPHWYIPVDDTIFSYFVHDIQTVGKGESITDRFFTIRKMEMPSPFEEKTKIIKQQDNIYNPHYSINQFWTDVGGFR
ncbi:DUF2235 domain-containing protein [Providencia rettgeri]|uniref:DUF2235 domain-containing protein n=1 Tax=Providencia rettgeri TaxID=587 RepID=UPI001B37CE21|nr:DUF2235 domain-containing protein [Providencia rettgeri]MBQ0326238.1 DUF2235 domain-containing protein [Providencia rettgeri]